jgi:subtilisin
MTYGVDNLFSRSRGGSSIRPRSVTPLLLLAALALLMPTTALAAPPDQSQSWIVQLAPGTDVGRFVVGANRGLGVRPTHVYDKVLNGFSARLTPAQLEALENDPRVTAMQLDQPTRIAADPQPVPPGISRVGANPSAVHAVDGSDPLLDVDIAILDTGVQQAHPDLRVVGGKNCTTSGEWSKDGHGHGTHVAGIAAARDNSFGVVGVAPGARIWSVKVLDQYGNGFTSWLICGLDWVATRTDQSNPSLPRIEVANMSLRTAGADDGNCGLSNNDLLHQAICRLDRAGITAVAAAGNDARDASRWVPAAYDEVITVSALADYDGQSGGAAATPAGCGTADDAFAAFSNFGDDVDLIAPGVCIESTFRKSSYSVMSGTSMAAPHTAGGAALYHLREAQLGRPRPTPEQVRAALIKTGSSNWRTNTDPDPNHEPLLRVASLDPAAGFEIGATPSSTQRGPGETATYDIWLARLGGFTGTVSFNVSGYPAGSSWSIGGDPFAAGESGWRRLTIELPFSGSGNYDIEITASSSGQPSRSVIVGLQFEGGVIGAAGAPRMDLRAGVASAAVALPVRIKWPAVSNAQRYELQVSRDGGPWTALTLASKTQTKLNTTAWPGSTYRYRLRVKQGGSWGPWLLGPPSIATPNFADTAALSGSWTSYTSAKTYSEVPAYSTQAGARATLDFTGRSVSWITTRGPKRGKARVYVDGALVTTVDLYAASNQFRWVAFSQSWSSAGSHQLRIEVRGTAGRPRVDLDAFVVVSTN